MEEKIVDNRPIDAVIDEFGNWISELNIADTRLFFNIRYQHIKNLNMSKEFDEKGYMRVMSILEMRGPLPVGQLAKIADKNPKIFYRLLDKMEKEGYIERHRDPTNRLKIIVSITKMASDLLERNEKIFIEFYRNLFNKYLTKEECVDMLEHTKKLTYLFRKVLESIDKESGEYDSNYLNV